jgi:hypothetical protein
LSLDFADVPTQGGGWFKPADHLDALAILVEVKSFDRQRPTPNGPKDSALTDVSVFNSQDDLDNGTPTVIKGTRIEQTILARDLANMVGKALVVRVEQLEAKKAGQRPAWVWRPADGGPKQAVVKYATEREAALKAAADAAPSFD